MNDYDDKTRVVGLLALRTRWLICKVYFHCRKSRCASSLTPEVIISLVWRLYFSFFIILDGHCVVVCVNNSCVSGVGISKGRKCCDLVNAS